MNTLLEVLKRGVLLTLMLVVQQLEKINYVSSVMEMRFIKDSEMVIKNN